jgi:hypothetical protein
MSGPVQLFQQIVIRGGDRGGGFPLGDVVEYNPMAGPMIKAGMMMISSIGQSCGAARRASLLPAPSILSAPK